MGVDMHMNLLPLEDPRKELSSLNNLSNKIQNTKTISENVQENMYYNV